MVFLLLLAALTRWEPGRFPVPLPLGGASIRHSRSMTVSKTGDPLTINRLYGRSTGHKLRKSQQELIETLLPQIEVPADGEITAMRLFGDERPLHFEIGIGSGE